MILTSREADPQIQHALITGELVSDDVARTIAAGLHSAAARDEQLTRLSHGLEFEPRGLVTRLDELISDKFARTDVLAELHALRAWALARSPHLEVITYQLNADAWQAWSQEWGNSSRAIPREAEPGITDVTLAANVADDLGEWVYPGDARYPQDPDSYADYDAKDGGVWLPATLVDAAAGMLADKGSGFWAESYGGDPFAPADGWGQAGRWEDLGPGQSYASRYVHPYGNGTEVKVARLVGFSAEQQEQVYRAWRG